MYFKASPYRRPLWWRLPQWVRQCTMGTWVERVLSKPRPHTFVCSVSANDTFRLTHNLSQVIIHLLTELRKVARSCPNIDMADIPLNIRVKHTYGARLPLVYWQWILDEMIFAFSTAHTASPAQAARVKNGMRLFGKYYLHLNA